MQTDITRNKNITRTVFQSVCGEFLIHPNFAAENRAIQQAIEDDNLDDLREAFTNEF